MQKLYEVIGEKAAPKHIKRFKELLPQMLTQECDPIQLHEEDLLTTLQKEGEFELHLLTYVDMRQELQEHQLPKMIYQSLDIVASFEDDGRHTKHIEDMIKHIHSYLEKEQRFVFGVKKVDQTSRYPMKILFGEILPINQLQARLGTELYTFLDADKEHYIEHFKLVRDAISDKIGITFLRLAPQPDASLHPKEVHITDPLTNKTVASFFVEGDLDKKKIEVYFLKLYSILLQLAQEMKKRQKSL